MLIIFIWINFRFWQWIHQKVNESFWILGVILKNQALCIESTYFYIDKLILCPTSHQENKERGSSTCLKLTFQAKPGLYTTKWSRPINVSPRGKKFINYYCRHFHPHIYNPWFAADSRMTWWSGFSPLHLCYSVFKVKGRVRRSSLRRTWRNRSV